MTQTIKISLKELVNAKTDYIRIYPTQNKLFSIFKNSVKTFGKNSQIVETFVEVDIPIKMWIKDTVNARNEGLPSVIHLHSSHAETLTTLLALKPSELEIEYWNKGMSKEWETEHKQQIEMIFFKAKIGKKEFRIEISQPYENAQYGKNANWDSSYLAKNL
jgi:hypothetical protein